MAEKKSATPKKTTSKKKTTTKSSVRTKKEETKKDIIVEEKIEKPKSKEQKTELKRLYIVLGFVGILVLIGIISAIMAYKKSAQILNEVRQIKAMETEQIVYIVRDGCSYCELNEYNMKDLKEKYEVDYYEVDISKLTGNDLSAMVSELGLDASKFGTPTLVITKNNEVLETVDGLDTYNSLFNTLKSNNLISKDAKLYLNYLDLDNYMKTIKSKENQVIVLASSTCYYCLQERPILDKIAKEKNIKINWVYLDDIFTSQEDYDKFMTSLEWFDNNADFGTPTTLIVKDGKVEATFSGYREEEAIIQFYTQNKIIKG